MRARTLLLFLIAAVLGCGALWISRAWIATQRERAVAEATPVSLPTTPAKSILTARNPVQRGQILTAADLGWQPWPDNRIASDYVVIGSRTPESFAGSVARQPLAPGEPITDMKVVAAGSRGFLAAVLQPGMRAISIGINPANAAAGFISPGDRVDLLLTMSVAGSREQGTQRSGSETLLEDVRVIAVDQKLETRAGETVLAKTATLEVTPKQSEIIAVASDMGKISLSLRSLVSDRSAEPDGQGGEPPRKAVAASLTVDSEIIPQLRVEQRKSAAEVTILRGASGGGTVTTPTGGGNGAAAPGMGSGSPQPVAMGKPS